MKETIYLVVHPRGVSRMTKRLPDLNRGEIPVKVVVTIDQSAFREPVLEREIHVTDWREGIDLADVELREGFITEKEAEMIRQRRLSEMTAVLEARGFTIQPPPKPGPVTGKDTP